jgi:hypothetical protein
MLPNATPSLLLGALLAIAADLSGQAVANAPLRVVGEFPARVERVRPQQDGTTMLTLFVGPLRRAIRPGDSVHLFDSDGDEVMATASVVAETRVGAATGRLHVRVRIDDADVTAKLTARAAERRPGFPSTGDGRDAFVAEHGPKATIIAPFEPERGDDPAEFVRVGATGSSEPTGAAQRAPTHCSFTLRFADPVEPSTLRHVRLFAANGTTEVPLRVFATDTSNTRFRFEPPLGLTFTDDMRRATREDPERAHYHLRIAAGDGGVFAANGPPLALPFDLPITIDPDAATNRVAWRVLKAR